MIDNNYIIPTNIGLNGKPGGNADGKWYGGVYGCSFTVVVPQDKSMINGKAVAFSLDQLQQRAEMFIPNPHLPNAPVT